MKDQSTSIHDAAAKGFARAAGAYADGRPGYPAEIDSWLRETLGLRTGCVALDLGAGTGKLTSRLIDTGARVIAVEPVDAMLGILTGALPGVDARIGTADEIPLGDQTVDAVVCAQSFHWFAFASALAEIRRVLKPGGEAGPSLEPARPERCLGRRLDGNHASPRRRHTAISRRAMAARIPRGRLQSSYRNQIFSHSFWVARECDCATLDVREFYRGLAGRETGTGRERDLRSDLEHRHAC